MQMPKRTSANRSNSLCRRENAFEAPGMSFREKSAQVNSSILLRAFAHQEAFGAPEI